MNTDESTVIRSDPQREENPRHPVFQLTEQRPWLRHQEDMVSKGAQDEEEEGGNELEKRNTIEKNAEAKAVFLGQKSIKLTDCHQK